MSDTKTSPPRGSRALALMALIVGLGVGRFACAPSAGPADADVTRHAAPAGQASTWTCSMHPQFQLPAPGDCPICGMDLIPLASDDELSGGDEPRDNPRALRLSENALALAAVQTQPVVRRAVSHEVRMVGKVSYDETRLSTITAWVPSRLDRLFVDYTGISVRKGDHIAEVYSPDLIATQQELLQALATERALAGNALDILSTRQASTVQAARDRLRLWGLEESQIDEVVARGEPLEHITIRSPATGVVIHKDAVQGQTVQTGTRLFTIADLSALWVQLEAYESDLPWLHYGQHVDFRSEAWPGEVFHGRISFIDPVLDDRTRTVKVRLNVDNAAGKLKPAMFVRATLQAPINSSGALVDAEFADRWMCPMHPEVVSAEPGECSRCGMDLASTESLGFRAAGDEELPLVIPRTAPLITGKRAVVFVQGFDDDGARFFEGRDVLLGPRAGDWYVVEQGLHLGERVVSHGAFKLDSELQIRARPSMMNPDGGAPPPEHDEAR
ncbi:MAG: cation transporter [Planctomycetota bacterium]|nr:MAG: cation transporter [Planctomycetota bacterium]